jgi:asparagine synthase (glutamine-hydrolysing)
MCGIGGFVSTSGPCDRAWLEDIGRTMITTMRHRGPDDFGIYISPDERVVFAHTRLAIIDRGPGGAQPMRSPRGRVLSFNGEIFDYRRLRRDAALNGWKFCSESDTEVLLALIEQSADLPGRLASLNGMFAFAVYDEQGQTATLARDHFGIKPLFYCTLKNGIAFASEPAVLFTCGFVEPRLSPSDFLLQAAMRMESGGPKSWFSGILQLEPGQYARITTDRLIGPMNYWSPDLSRDNHEISFSMVEEAFTAAIAIRQYSDVKKGALLSGGIDSSSIVSCISAMGEKITPYVGVYEGSDTEQNADLPHALEMAAALGLSPNVVTVGYSGFELLIDEVTRVVQRPVLHGAECVMYRIYDAVSQGPTKVLYSGHGADEMWGYQDGRYFPILGQTMYPDMHSRYFLSHKYYQSEQPEWHRFLADRLAPCLGLRAEAIPDLIWNEGLHEYRHAPTMDPVRRARYQLIRRFLVYVNHMVDALSMRFSLEERPPFEDLRLFELAFALPEYIKNRRGISDTKPFLRQALYKLLPKTILTRPKTGFQPPRDGGFRAACLGALRSCRHPPFGLKLNDDELERAPTTLLVFLTSTESWIRQFQVS